MSRPVARPFLLDGVESIRILDGPGHYFDLPSLTTAERDSLSPDNGFMIYNSTTLQVEAYQNGAWGAVGGTTTYLGLTDTSSAYTGSAGLPPKVNATEDALEFGTLDHGTALTGLADDDHPQYLLADGTRALAGNWSLAGHDLAALGKLNFDDATTLTIATGAITVTQSYHRVDTEAAAATDDLTTINGGIAGDILYLVAADDTHTVVLKHDDTAGAGKIVTSDGLDYSLDNDDKVVALVYDSADSHWHMVGAAGGGSGSSTFIADTDTPSGYTGYAGYVAAVNAGETGLEFVPHGFTSGCKAYPSAAQTGIAASTETKIILDKTAYDNNGEFDTTNSKFVAANSGTYLMIGQVWWANNADQIGFQTLIYVNGTSQIGGKIVSSGTSYQGALAVGIVSLAAGDYVELYGRQNSSGTMDTYASPSYTFLVVKRLS